MLLEDLLNPKELKRKIEEALTEAVEESTQTTEFEFLDRMQMKEAIEGTVTPGPRIPPYPDSPPGTENDGIEDAIEAHGNTLTKNFLDPGVLGARNATFINLGGGQGRIIPNTPHDIFLFDAFEHGYYFFSGVQRGPIIPIADEYPGVGDIFYTHSARVAKYFYQKLRRILDE